ncbi:enolase C-terminal domain-like protein [Phytoactinopolyspora halotolerans]|uniref:Mandelate racemase n=1 Tax=Phytoactinopolyspora halotolerans TaxID=1981512 RepID=A0A6L9SAA3_9ACTN|nr:enolase C-terminal domain-like protein [Phytoactinopolyspora halotolerans]NEE02037.1 mandelate racemase [Phytoactinopolyspora halotolerans]
MPDPAIDGLDATVLLIPTPVPEADGTLEWDSTTVIMVHVRAGDVTGLGYTYADRACVPIIHGSLADVVLGRPLLDVPGCWLAMQHRIRNDGRPGLVSCAMSAVDIALWDAAAKTVGVPVSRLLGRVHNRVPVYASGGFTTYDDARLTEELEQWVHERAVPRFKLKIAEAWGGNVARDLTRVALARRVAGPDAELYVDANGGYTVGQAVRVGQRLAEHGVTWFEEPVSSDDLDGLRRVRGAVAADVTAGEYGYHLQYFTRMIDARALDCVQVDVTRCGGYTEWLRIAALAAAHGLEISAHSAPNVSAHAAVATQNFRHIEWFSDHHRIESMLFEEVLDPRGGSVRPSRSEPGHGLALNRRIHDQYWVG